MHTVVPTKEKRNFIYWFLRTYKLKKRESEWLLLYIAEHTEILKNVHFIRGAKKCPRGIELASTCSAKPAFLFYKKQLMTIDADKAYHDIRMNKGEHLYIELHFKNAIQSSHYALVLENNPYRTVSHHIQNADRQQTNNLLGQIIFNRKQTELKKKIDSALDHRDSVAFMKFTKELENLQRDGIENDEAKN
ncbi:ReoY family proteolytic degradation factor [Virgibacillus sp. W0181]|uniref:ReoY family proteolytic degradation factor n=1 Tax=Virgibacillus sp. W0181 TaxID=3391581 RepID=UPI003F462759